MRNIQCLNVIQELDILIVEQFQFVEKSVRGKYQKTFNKQIQNNFWKNKNLVKP